MDRNAVPNGRQGCPDTASGLANDDFNVNVAIRSGNDVSRPEANVARFL